MNKTEINFKGSTIALVFGTWVMGQLIKSGYSLATLKDDMTNNPFEFFPLLVYLGAVNALPSKDLDHYSKNDFYDWIDNAGGIGSDSVSNVIKVFTNSLSNGIPKKKTTPKT